MRHLIALVALAAVAGLAWGQGPTGWMGEGMPEIGPGDGRPLGKVITDLFKITVKNDLILKERLDALERRVQSLEAGALEEARQRVAQYEAEAAMRKAGYVRVKLASPPTPATTGVER